MSVWIPITLAAAFFQVARNAAQRSLAPLAGPWAAALVRFLFGLPFALVLAGGARLFDPHVRLALNAAWLGDCAAGAAAQAIATAALLGAMQRGGFAFGAVMQQSSIPLAALFGLALGEPLRGTAWAGVVITAAGLAALNWPRGDGARNGFVAGVLGLVAGVGFAIAANAFRQSAHALVHGHAFLAAQTSLVAAQAMQSAAMVAALAVLDRRALRSAVGAWRTSLGAGFFGAVASSLWFTAFALAPAGPVRAVGAIEAPLSLLAGRQFFAERLSRMRMFGLLATGLGVILAAAG